MDSLARRGGLALLMGGEAAKNASLLALFAGVILVGLTPVADGDIFWHLAAGRHIWTTGTLPRTDTFSVSAFGRPWVDVHWLFQLASLGVHAVGGLLGLVWVKATLVAGAAALLARGVARAGSLVAFAAAMLLALFAARHLLAVRPTIVTLLMMAVYFALLERHADGGSPRALWALPPLQLLWSNCQSLAVLGPIMIAAYLIGAACVGRTRLFSDGGRTRPLLMVLATCLAASLSTPFGVESVRLPWRLFGRIVPDGNVFAAQVAENLSPLSRAGAETGEALGLPWFLIGLGVCLIVGRQRLRMARVLLLAALVFLALLANRNVLLLYWLGTPMAFLTLGPLPRRLEVTAGLPLVAALALAFTAFRREPSLAAPTPFRFPTEGAAWLARANARGDVFTADHHGGYLIWQLTPYVRPYIDTRLILRTAAEYQEFLQALDDPATFDRLQARHRFAFAVLPTAYPARYLTLIAHLGRNTDWRLVHTDGAETIFAFRSSIPSVNLRDDAVMDGLVAQLGRRHPGQELQAAAREHLVTLLLTLGHDQQAARMKSAPLQR